MPEAYAKRHDYFMTRYFENPTKTKVLNFSRLVFPINKEGYIVPCSLYIKILPNLDFGI